MKILLLILTTIPLIFGGVIYICFREDSYLIDTILTKVISTSSMEAISTTILEYIDLSQSAINSLPSALWVFSASILTTRLKLKKRAMWYFAILTPLLYSVILEILQHCNLTDGTFDNYDIIYSAFGWILGLIVAKIYDMHPRSLNINLSTLCLCYLVLFLGNVY